jgi:hypothetical protein
MDLSCKLNEDSEMNKLVFLTVALGSLATVSFAAEPASTIRADLDRDGRPETFSLSNNGASQTSLTITRPGKSTIIARDIAWSLEPATLTRAPNGSLLLNTSHIGVGRSPHEQTLTIAFRGGTYQVVGITRGNWDRIEPDASTSCDINLLTGRGTVNNRPVRRTAIAKAVTAWKWDQDLPRGCAIE